MTRTYNFILNVTHDDIASGGTTPDQVPIVHQSHLGSDDVLSDAQTYWVPNANSWYTANVSLGNTPSLTIRGRVYVWSGSAWATELDITSGDLSTVLTYVQDCVNAL